MGSLAEMAPEHARRRISGQLAEAPTLKAPKISTPPLVAKPRSLEVVVTGPINHFMFLEGRNWAVEMVASLRPSPLAGVIERLAGAAVDRPGSYAAGIQSVIKELQETDVTDQCEGGNLTHQAE